MTGIALTGWSGVTLFFVLSGFLLFMPYARAILFDHAWPSARTFYLRRAFRILPGYYVALVVLILLEHHEYLQPDHLKDLALFVTFFMDATQATFQQINGPFWTLAVEWQYYMLLPLLALGFCWIARRGSLRRRLLLLGGCLLGMMVWGVASRYWGPYLLAHPEAIPVPRPLFNIGMFFLYGFAGKYLEDFAIGMLISVCYILLHNVPAHREQTQESEATAKNYGRAVHGFVAILGKSGEWLWGLGVFWLFFMAVRGAIPTIAFLKPFFDAQHPFSEVGFAIGYGLCVAGLLFGPPELKRFLEWQPLRWIGLISYGLYIWHLPFLIWFWSHVLPVLQNWNWNGTLVYVLFWSFVALAIIPFCYLFYRGIEQPWIKIGGRITKKNVSA